MIKTNVGLPLVLIQASLPHMRGGDRLLHQVVDGVDAHFVVLLPHFEVLLFLQFQSLLPHSPHFISWHGLVEDLEHKLLSFIQLLESFSLPLVWVLLVVNLSDPLEGVFGQLGIGLARSQLQLVLGKHLAAYLNASLLFY